MPWPGLRSGGHEPQWKHFAALGACVSPDCVFLAKKSQWSTPTPSLCTPTAVVVGPMVNMPPARAETLVALGKGNHLFQKGLFSEIPGMSQLPAQGNPGPTQGAQHRRAVVSWWGKGTVQTLHVLSRQPVTGAEIIPLPFLFNFIFVRSQLPLYFWKEKMQIHYFLIYLFFKVEKNYWRSKFLQAIQHWLSLQNNSVYRMD